MDLINEAGEEFRFNTRGWAFYLNLAEEYGWEPRGTKRPQGRSIFKKWHGEYDSNEGQRVSAKDSDALAHALELALRDPLRASKAEALAKRIDQQVAASLGHTLVCETRVDRDDSRYLVEMIAFFRKGEFKIM